MFAGPASNAYSDVFITFAFIYACGLTLGTVSYSNSGFKFKIPIDTLWLFESDGIVALLEIKNVNAEPTVGLSTFKKR